MDYDSRRVRSQANRLRQAAKAATRHVALDLLADRWVRSGRVEAGFARPRVHFLYLHAVPEGDETRFQSLLDRLAETHDMVSHTRAVELVTAGDVSRPTVSFSFDDGFASNYRTARTLEEYGTVGMFFVPTTFIGTATVGEARQIFGYSQHIDEPAMTWAQLEELRSRGHEVGNHTRTHPNLATLSGDQVRDEIEGGAEILRERLGECRHFAWPFGRWVHFSLDAARIVFESGHESCASAERGAHAVTQLAAAESVCLRRDHLMSSWPLRHMEYFIARASLQSDVSSNGWPEWAAVK